MQNVKKTQKDIEREAFGNAKKAGYRGKELKHEVGFNLHMAEYENKNTTKKTPNHEKGDI